MSAKVSVLIFAVLLILGIVIFRYFAGMHALRSDPHAAQEIEKAKQR